MDSPEIVRKNFWLHVTEGAVYLSSNVLLSPQTVFPALVAKLGGDNVAVGAIPIIVYLVFYFPQILSANYIRSSAFRKPWTLKLGMMQRLQILLFSIVVAVFGAGAPRVALAAFFIIYVASQVLNGLGSPVWFDLVAKTTTPADRGKLMGFRISIGALLGLLNGFVLTLLLAFLTFPYNFAAVFAFAFFLQLSSWLILRRVVETRPSEVITHDSFPALFIRIRSILRRDLVYRRFLISTAFLVVGLMPMGFFMIASLREYHLPESYVGLFTITMVVAQVLSGVFLGWLADVKGHRVALILCAAATASATILGLVGSSPVFFFAVFFFVGMNLGAEMVTRYNFVERCAPDSDRPLYVGVMNAWLAPFYFSATIGGWVSDRFGYKPMFAMGLVATSVGIALLYKTADPGRPKTAGSR